MVSFIFILLLYYNLSLFAFSTLIIKPLVFCCPSHLLFFLHVNIIILSFLSIWVLQLCLTYTTIYNPLHLLLWKWIQTGQSHFAINFSWNVKKSIVKDEIVAYLWGFLFSLKHSKKYPDIKEIFLSSTFTCWSLRRQTLPPPRMIVRTTSQ